MATRSKRHALLAEASAFGVVAGLVLISKEALRLSDYMPYYPTYYIVGQALALAGAVAVAAAFGASVLGFLKARRESRAGLLAIAAGLFGAYGAANFAGWLVEVLGQPSSESWEFLAAQAASVAGPFLLLVAALLLAVAVLSRRPRLLLGWTCLALCAHFALSAAALGFSLAGEYESGFFRPDGRTVAGFVANGAGYSTCAIAALVAAIAFWAGGSQRSRKLARASTLLVVGFLTAMGGVVVIATGAVNVSIALTAAYPFVLAAAAAVGVAAFLASEQRDGPDLAVAPDPA